MVFKTGDIPWNKGKARKACRVCGVSLDTNVNWNPAYEPQHNYICRTCANNRRKQYRESNPTYKQTEKEYYQRNREHYSKRQRTIREKNREVCISHYSNGSMCCACCGENRIEFLSIDHINGGGRQHRISINKNDICAWLIKNKFPGGFRILCYNCNQAIGIYGYCPHNKLNEGDIKMKINNKEVI